MPETRTEWARLGALTRLQQIDQERQAILRAFPDLKGRKGAANGATSPKPKRRFSAAARRRMRLGMKKYWAKRKTGAKKI
jgi:hypothetical protein